MRIKRHYQDCSKRLCSDYARQLTRLYCFCILKQCPRVILSDSVKSTQTVAHNAHINLQYNILMSSNSYPQSTCKRTDAMNILYLRQKRGKRGLAAQCYIPSGKPSNPKCSICSRLLIIYSAWWINYSVSTKKRPQV